MTITTYPKLQKRNIRAGDIILCKPAEYGFVSKAIHTAQVAMGFGEEDAQYTHAMVAGFGLYTASAVWPRVEMVNIQEHYIDKGYEIKVYRYNKWSVRNGISDRARFVAYCFADNNMPYDWVGLFGFIGRLFKLVKNLHQSGGVFCSEQVMRGLLKTNVKYYLTIAWLQYHRQAPHTISSPDMFSPAHISFGCRHSDDWQDVTSEYFDVA